MFHLIDRNYDAGRKWRDVLLIKVIRKKYEEMPIQLKASIWFLICSFLQKGISIITTPIFTRLLTTAEYGQYNVFNSWLSIVSIFVSLSLAAGVYSQGLVKFEEDRDVFSSSMQGLSTTLIFLWMVIYLAFRDYWNKILSLSTVQILSMLMMIWTSAVFSFWATEQRVQYKYKALLIISLVVSLAKPILGVVFVVLADDKVTARILGLLFVEIIIYIWLFLAQMLKGKKFFSKKYWKYAFCFNLPLIPHYLSQAVLIGADRIMIEKFIGVNEAGIYGLAYSISQIMTIFNTALLGTMSPWILRKIRDRKIVEISVVSYVSMICIAVANLILIAFAPEAVAIFAPKEYHDAIWVIPPVAISVFFMYLYDLFSKFAFYYEKTTFIMFASIIGAILNIILNLVAINIFGYIAAGYTTLICYAVYSLGHYMFMNKICDRYLDKCRPYDVRCLLGITVLFICLSFILLSTYNYPSLRYMGIVFILIVTLKKRQVIRRSIVTLIAIKNK